MEHFEFLQLEEYCETIALKLRTSFDPIGRFRPNFFKSLRKSKGHPPIGGIKHVV